MQPEHWEREEKFQNTRQRPFPAKHSGLVSLKTLILSKLLGQRGRGGKGAGAGYHHSLKLSKRPPTPREWLEKKQSEIPLCYCSTLATHRIFQVCVLRVPY